MKDEGGIEKRESRDEIKITEKCKSNKSELRGTKNKTKSSNEEKKPRNKRSWNKFKTEERKYSLMNVNLTKLSPKYVICVAPPC